MSTALIILAAGQGTRMNSDLPKVLHKVAGAPLIEHAIASGFELAPEKTVVIAGHGADLVRDAVAEIDPEATVVVQAEQLGTAHAVAQAQAALDGFDGDAIILYGDTPFVRAETLDEMLEARKSHAVVVLGFEPTDPARYGRLVMDGDSLEEIVEFKDATEDQRAIALCNSGVVCADSATLFDLVSAVKNENASGEYYLTDIVAIARARGLSATAVTCKEEETMGVNSREDLAQAETAFQASARSAALRDGVTLTAPETVFFAFDTVVGRDTIIEPNVVFGPGVTIESSTHIRAFSHLEGCHVSRGSIIGPFARLRPGAELAENVHVGNFVEIKNAQVDAGAKVNHLSYIGDASIGEKTNVGAGTITCNYDGVFKHRTTIGKNVFVGSNTMLVAPVSMGDNSMTATGTIVTSDVPDGALAVGRAKQVNKDGLAVRMFEKLKNLKKNRSKDV